MGAPATRTPALSRARSMTLGLHRDKPPCGIPLVFGVLIHDPKKTIGLGPAVRDDDIHLP